MSPANERPPRPEIALYRCDCTNCDAAEEELRRLAARGGAAFAVKRVQAEGLGQLAGWATPVVYVNGIEISHYSLGAAKWKRAIETPLRRVSLRGEIVDFQCYVEEHALGPEHRDCAENCINEIKLPVGLVTTEGDAYQLAAPIDVPIALESLKQAIGRQVEIRGDLFAWEAKRTVTVREIL